jgi:26S proteasome regulatory subunit N8
MSNSIDKQSNKLLSSGKEGASSSSAACRLPNVVVHPLVLLSAVDHYTRVAKDTQKRVVGVLLGTHRRAPSGSSGPAVVDVTNSFAVPFEEDLRNPAVWFLDHDYLDTMYWKFKKVNSEYKYCMWPLYYLDLLPFFFSLSQ